MRKRGDLMERYEKPEMEIIALDGEDIITTGNTDPAQTPEAG